MNEDGKKELMAKDIDSYRPRDFSKEPLDVRVANHVFNLLLDFCKSEKKDSITEKEAQTLRDKALGIKKLSDEELSYVDIEIRDEVKYSQDEVKHFEDKFSLPPQQISAVANGKEGGNVARVASGQSRPDQKEMKEMGAALRSMSERDQSQLSQGPSGEGAFKLGRPSRIQMKEMGKGLRLMMSSDKKDKGASH